MFRVTQPYLNLLEKPKKNFRFSEKKMHFERPNAFQSALNYIFFQNKKCVPTLPKLLRPVTQNTLIFFIWPNIDLKSFYSSLYMCVCFYSVVSYELAGGGSRISGKGVHMYKGVEVCFADFISFFFNP